MQAIDDLTSGPQARVVRERLVLVLPGSKVICARFHITSGTQLCEEQYALVRISKTIGTISGLVD
jgi:hypothetical protein